MARPGFPDERKLAGPSRWAQVCYRAVDKTRVGTDAPFTANSLIRVRRSISFWSVMNITFQEVCPAHTIKSLWEVPTALPRCAISRVPGEVDHERSLPLDGRFACRAGDVERVGG
ncbi:hypothetical protein GCM10028797_02910 [Dyella agri]